MNKEFIVLYLTQIAILAILIFTLTSLNDKINELKKLIKDKSNDT